MKNNSNNWRSTLFRSHSQVSFKLYAILVVGSVAISCLFIYFAMPIIKSQISFSIMELKKVFAHKNSINEEKNINNVQNITLPEWDLTTLYNNIDDPLIEHDIMHINSIVQQFAKEYKDVSFYLISPKKLYNILLEQEKIAELSYKLNLFAYLMYAKNTNNQQVTQFYTKIVEQNAQWSSALSFLKYKFYSIKPHHLSKLYNHSLIKHHAPYIKQIMKYKAHQLSPDVDKFSIEKSVSNESAIVQFYDQNLASLEVEYSGKKYNLPQAIAMLQSTNRAERLAVSNAINEQLKAKINIFTFVFNSLFKSKEVEDRWARYKYPLHSETIANDFDKELLERVVDVVTTNYPNTSHRYYKIKAKLMNLDKLDYADRNAPIYEDAIKYSWNDAKEITLTAYNNFSPALKQEALWFFENNRIDAVTKNGKQSGAFCTTINPFVMLNFTNKLNDVTTLAHEIGHGIQMKLSTKQYGVLMSNAPLILAEVPSTFGESLVMQEMTRRAKSKKDKINILSTRIENALNTITRQIAFHQFEVKVHDLRSKGELSNDDIKKVWLEITKAQLGDYVAIENGCDNYWAYISHFVHHPFYVHSYAIADLTTYSLLKLYNDKQIDNFEEKYILFIRDMTVKNYNQLMSDFGFDIHNVAYWQAGMTYISQMIDELERLIEDKNA